MRKPEQILKDIYDKNKENNKKNQNVVNHYIKSRGNRSDRR